MKKEIITRLFKVKHTAGVHYRGNLFNYAGKSRLDGYPIYSIRLEMNEVFDIRSHLKDFIFNQRPGYTPTVEDFEWVRHLGDYENCFDDFTTRKKYDIVPDQPMNGPTGQYEDSDPRLLLML